jgi:hypothetical protein
MIDDDVSTKKGIYPYLLTGKEKYLSIRKFTEAMKQKVYVKKDAKCLVCGDEFDISKMEADHITPWHTGGKQMKKIAKCYAKKIIGGNQVNNY